MKIPEQIRAIAERPAVSEGSGQTVKIGSRTYVVTLSDSKFCVTRRMPNAGLLRFACATKDFFARGLSMTTRATAYASYLNDLKAQPFTEVTSRALQSRNINARPLSVAIHDIVHAQAAAPVQPLQPTAQSTPVQPSQLSHPSQPSQPSQPVAPSTPLQAAVAAAMVAEPAGQSGGGQVAAPAGKSEGAPSTGAVKFLTTSPSDGDVAAACEIFDAICAQEGNIGITMSSSQTYFARYENKCLDEVTVQCGDGMQATILDALKAVCHGRGRPDLLKRIFIVPFACDPGTSMSITDRNIQYARSFQQDKGGTLFVWGLPGRVLAIGGGKHTQEFPTSENYAKIKAALIPSVTAAVVTKPPVVLVDSGGKAVAPAGKSGKVAGVGVAKQLTTAIDDSPEQAARRIFAQLAQQSGRIGITMSSTHLTFEAYQGRNLAECEPVTYDGKQAQILRELQRLCAQAQRPDLLQRIYIVPFACDPGTTMQMTEQNIGYAQSFLQGQDSSLFAWGVPGRELAIGGGQHTHAFPSSENYARIKAALMPSAVVAKQPPVQEVGGAYGKGAAGQSLPVSAQTVPAIQPPVSSASSLQAPVVVASPVAPVPVNKFSVEEINDWLFMGKIDDRFPDSKLQGRKPENYLPKVDFASVPICASDKYAGRFGIHEGSITDLRAAGTKAAICSSNNGDLLTGCGYAVAKAVVNAAGPALQAELYNQYGVPGVMEVTEYGKQKYAASEGRGYALTCSSHDMAASHGLTAIELLTVPMLDANGVKNMYKEAFQHSKHLDYIAVPMAGMTHPVLNGNSARSAELATAAAKEFMDENPDSKLKIVFVIYDDPVAVANYRKQIV